MNDKSNRVSTEVSAGTSQQSETDRTRIRGVKGTHTPVAQTLQCVKSPGENNATTHLDGKILNNEKNADDQGSATNATMRCNSRLLGVVEETQTTARSMEASSGIDAPYGIPSEKLGDATGRKSRQITDGMKTQIMCHRERTTGAQMVYDST